MIKLNLQFFGGRGSGSYTAGGASVGDLNGGGEGTDLPTAGWTPEAGSRFVHIGTTLKGAEGRIIGLDHEQLVVIDKDGFVRAAVDGGEHSVGITANAAKYIKGNVVTHNHPNGGTFSPTDIISAGTTGAGEIRAASKRFNKTYSLKASSKANGRGLAKAMRKAERKLEKQWQSKLDGMVGRKYKSKESYERQAYGHWNKIMGGWLRTNAGKYGYTYSD